MSAVTGLVKDVPNFVYEPLPDASKWIRLLRIVSPPGSSLLECELENHLLQEEEGLLWRPEYSHYTALSYTWQPVEPQQEIRLLGAKKMIGYNLYQSLCNIPETYSKNGLDGDVKRMIWADAICINQNDPREKNKQVSSMAKIYSLARSLTIWLGAEKDDSNLVATMGEGVSIDLTNFIKSKRMWKALVAFAERPYWGRLWIVQEFFLGQSPTILCGQKVVYLKEFKEACEEFLSPTRAMAKVLKQHPSKDEFAEYRSRILQSGMMTLLDSIQLSKRGTTGPSPLVTLLREHRKRHCGDPRDIVYALLGLAFDEIPALLKPDYSKSNYSLFWDTLYSCRILADLHLLMFERLGLHFERVQDLVSTTQHLLDELETQKAKGLLCVCVRLHRLGRVLHILEQSHTANSEHLFKNLGLEKVFQPSATPETQFITVAIGDVKVDDIVYRITYTGIKLILRPHPLEYVGVAFTHQSNENFAEPVEEVYQKLKQRNEILRDIIPRGLRQIPAHLVGGKVQYDIVLDRKAILYFMSMDSRVMHRRWPGDGGQVVPYSDSGLQAAYRARTVQVAKCGNTENDSSVLVA
jgi:hypothetical protein